VADQGVQAVGEAGDLAVEAGGAQHLGEHVVAGLGGAEEQVLAQGAEQRASNGSPNLGSSASWRDLLHPAVIARTSPSDGFGQHSRQDLAHADRFGHVGLPRAGPTMDAGEVAVHNRLRAEEVKDV